MKARRQSALWWLPLVGLVALAAVAHAGLFAASFVPASSSSGRPWERRSRGGAVVRHVSKYYSNIDRDRLSKLRKELRIQAKERTGPTTPTIDFDKLPAIDDIYNRKYSGNATVDPIGGRKRYSYFVLFKRSPGQTAAGLSQLINEYIWFLKNKMSCKDIRAKVMPSPIDQSKMVTLEYPMKEYGDIPRGVMQKPEYNKAYLVKYDFFAPVSAHEYIQRKIYADNNILRFMVIGHTRTFKHAGEDNELHL